MTLPTPSRETIDAVYLYAMLERLEEVLQKAQLNVSFFRREIESLTAQEALPPRYREAYNHMVKALLRIERAIMEEEGKQEIDSYSEFVLRSLREEDNPLPELIAAAHRTIAQINDAEDRLVRVAESARKALLEHAEQGLIDWTMPLEYEFTFLLDPGDTRAFYATCAEGEEPLRLALLPACIYSPRERGYNWNTFEGREGHPLQTGHHGYLVHCLLDPLHMGIPWQLLPFIKDDRD